MPPPAPEPLVLPQPVVDQGIAPPRPPRQEIQKDTEVVEGQSQQANLINLVTPTRNSRLDATRKETFVTFEAETVQRENNGLFQGPILKIVFYVKNQIIIYICLIIS